MLTELSRHICFVLRIFCERLARIYEGVLEVICSEKYSVNHRLMWHYYWGKLPVTVIE